MNPRTHAAPARASAPALAEFEATPARLLVHDPSTSGALERLQDVPAEELKDRCLFGAHPEPGAFGRQHSALLAVIAEAGVEVVRLGELVRDEQLGRNPNLVYTRDSAITLPWLPGWYFLGSMREPLRRPEADVLAAALQACGLQELFAAPPGCFLEGGDVIPFVADGRRTLLVGYGPRTNRRSLDLLWERLAPWALDLLVGVRLAEWRMNLDGVLVPAAEDVAVAHPGSIEGAFLFDNGGRRDVEVLDFLRGLGMTVVEVTREESMERQACNVLCLGERRVVCYDLCTRVVDALRGRGLDVRPIPASELIKGTGGPRCMTRPVYA